MIMDQETAKYLWALKEINKSLVACRGSKF
jgi:hypothetical protein